MGAGIRKDRSGLAGLQKHPCTNIFPPLLVSGQRLPEPLTSKSRTVPYIKNILSFDIYPKYLYKLFSC